MERRPVDSTSVASAGYDAAGRVLEVEFRSGGLYAYLDVPPEVFCDLLAAESAGGFVNRVVKPRFRYRRLARRTG